MTTYSYHRDTDREHIARRRQRIENFKEGSEQKRRELENLARLKRAK